MFFLKPLNIDIPFLTVNSFCDIISYISIQHNDSAPLKATIFVAL